MNHQLIIHYFDKLFQSWRPLMQQERPREGWIRSLRQALGLSTVYLGKKLNLSQSNITMLEKREQQGTITFQTLARVAEAMNCQLVYALVPTEPIEELLRQQAVKKAQSMLSAVTHTMALEGQSLTPEANSEQVHLLAQELLQKNPKKLWENLS